MRSPLVTRVRQLYGAHPLQLLLILSSFVVVGYTLWLLGFTALWNPDTWWQSIAVWFVGAALAHDLLLFPVYAAADRILVAASRRQSIRDRRSPALPMINYVRVPLLAVGLITLLFFPGVIRQGAGSYNRATGQTQEPFLLRWVLLCAVILLVGLGIYLVARVRARRRATVVTADLSPAMPASKEAPNLGAARLAPAPAWAALVVAILVALAGRRRRDQT